MYGEVRQVLAGYSVGKIHRISRIPQGYGNINLSADTVSGMLFVRVSPKKSTKELEKEVHLMQVLKKHAFPAAYPLEGGDGKYIHLTSYGPALVYPFLFGSPPLPTYEQIRKTATYMARLHGIPAGEVPEKTNTIRPSPCAEIIRHPTSCLPPTLRERWLQTFEKIRRSLETPLPTGLIHGDLFPDNVLFKNGELIAFLDFEEFAIDTFLFDIAMAVNGFCLSRGRPNARKTALFLDAYEKIRPLLPEEKEHLQAYLVWTALGMACWHVGDCRKNGPQSGQRERIRKLIELAEELRQKY